MLSVWVHLTLLQLCLTLCSPVDCCLPGSSVHGILQARILEWVAMPSFRGSYWPRDWTYISCVSCIGRQVLYHCATWKPQLILAFLQSNKLSLFSSSVSSHSMWISGIPKDLFQRPHSVSMTYCFSKSLPGMWVVLLLYNPMEGSNPIRNIFFLNSRCFTWLPTEFWGTSRL